MVQWLSDPFAPLSKVEAVNTTQQYMRDLNTELAFSIRGGSLYVNMLSVFSTVVINAKHTNTNHTDKLAKCGPELL